MNYNFDTLINRRNTSSLKWDVTDRELPMWIADMDFETAPEIKQALSDRVSHGVFGYSVIPQEWYTAYTDWWRTRHGLHMQADWLLFSTGVISSISSIVRKLTTTGENILVQTPVYNHFYNSILDNGRNVTENQLIYENGTYSIDFDDLDEKLSDPQTTMMILCSPHNPIGKIWDKKTLERIGSLCLKHHVLVVSDEIHCDITDPGCDYVPFASISEDFRQNSITCIAPTKTFNLAGLHTSAVVVPNEVLRHKVKCALHTDQVGEANVFAISGAVAAFTKGESWLAAFREYLYANKCFVESFLSTDLPQLKLIASTATYLLWVDCSTILDDSAKNSGDLAEFLREQTGLYVNDGTMYRGNGTQFLRLNIACPRATLEEGLRRLKEGVLAYQA